MLILPACAPPSSSFEEEEEEEAMMRAEQFGDLVTAALVKTFGVIGGAIPWTLLQLQQREKLALIRCHTK